MADLQQQIADLRAQVDALGDFPDPALLNELERTARSLLADSKNTPYEAAAQALFADLARAKQEEAIRSEKDGDPSRSD